MTGLSSAAAAGNAPAVGVTHSARCCKPGRCFSSLPFALPPASTHPPAALTDQPPVPAHPGYLIIYYAGVMKVFEQLGIYKPGKAHSTAPPVAGSSSGALTSAAICSGVSAEEFYKTVRAGCTSARVAALVLARSAARGPGAGVGFGVEQQLPAEGLVNGGQLAVDRLQGKASLIDDPRRAQTRPQAAPLCRHPPPPQINGLTAACYSNSSACAGNMDDAVRATLSGLLPPDAAERCNASGLSVSLTVYDTPGQARNDLATTFDNRTDLISTLAASAYIPIWSGSKLFTGWRGRNALDGSITQRQPCPPGVAYCVRISSTPPDMLAEIRAASRGNTLGAAIRQIQRAVRGERTAAANVTKPPLPAIADARPDAARLAVLRNASVDIVPGLSIQKLPFSAQLWDEMSTLPCDPATCDYLYKLGELDAWAWAEATGIKAAWGKRKAAAARMAGATAGAPKPMAAAVAAPVAAASGRHRRSLRLVSFGMLL